MECIFLLGQCLDKIPKTRVISEPFSFVNLNALYVKGHVSFVEYKRLLESTFRLQCKIEKDADIDHIVMKWNPYGTASIPYLKVNLIKAFFIIFLFLNIYCKYSILHLAISFCRIISYNQGTTSGNKFDTKHKKSCQNNKIMDKNRYFLCDVRLVVYGLQSSE